MRNEIEIQREYYTNTAEFYNDMHVNYEDEHFFALRFMESIVDFYNIRSILDIGAGTGRTAQYLKNKYPHLKIVSVEPVYALRKIGYENGLSEEELVEGDATNLRFSNKEFDLVCEFGVLHHIQTPSIAVKEMLRVSRIGIFISDSNNFGQGAYVARTLKQILNAMGLWKFADFIKTKGKGYTISEGDGLAYSYSVFNDYKLIAKHCKVIHLLNTKDGSVNPYKTASHVALLGIK